VAGRREELEKERREQALRDLERVNEQSEIVGTSQLKRSAERARDHFTAVDANADDGAEIWGRRIGRALSLVFFIGLIVYLVMAYLLP